jgi:hypothetical protein
MRKPLATRSSHRRTSDEIDELLARCGAALCLATLIAGLVWLWL